MTTAAQLIEALSKLDPNAEVQCLKEYNRGYQSSTIYAEVDLEDMYVYDYTSEKYKNSSLYGKTILELQAI